MKFLQNMSARQPELIKAREPFTNEQIFSNIFDGSVANGYQPIQPLVDEKFPVRDINAFNDWTSSILNPRLRNVHARITNVERIVNDYSRSQPGFVRNFLRGMCATYFYNEYKYNFKDNYVYDEDFDSAGEPYNYIEKFKEKVILLPVTGVTIPDNDEDFTVLVYRDGRPLSRNQFDFQRQHGSFSIFIPYSKFMEGSVYAVKLLKFWNTPKYVQLMSDETNTDEHNTLRFIVDEAALGVNYCTYEQEQLDYNVYEINANGYAKILPAHRYSIRKSISNNAHKLMCAVKNVKSNNVYVLVNNSCGWERTIDTGATPTNEIILTHEQNDDFPIVNSASELIIETYEQEQYTGMSFRLVPDQDFFLNNNNDTTGHRTITLIRELPPHSTVRIIKADTNSWYKNEKFFLEVPRDGIVEVKDSPLPLDVLYMDVVLNNKVINKSELTNILDTAFRINDYDSSKNLYYRVVFPRTLVVKQLIDGYANFKSDMERFLEHVGFNSNISINYDGVTDTYKGKIYTLHLPSDTWHITHDLGFEPSVQVISALTNSVVLPNSIDHIDSNTLVLRFNEPIAGRARLV